MMDSSVDGNEGMVEKPPLYEDVKIKNEKKLNSDSYKKMLANRVAKRRAANKVAKKSRKYNRQHS